MIVYSFARKKCSGWLLLAVTEVLAMTGVGPTTCWTHAGDWPQFLGPQRDGTAVDEAPLNGLPAGLRPAWRCQVGQGYAGAAIAGNRVYIYHRDGDKEIVESRANDTGTVDWKQSFHTDYVCSYNSDGGPRCVPLIDRDRLVLFGAGGHLRCLDCNNGETLWEHDTQTEYDAQEGYFGAGSSPVVYGELVIVNVGGRKGVGIGAFRLADGSLQWSIPDEQASYAAPKIQDVDGSPQLLCITRLNFVTANPATGQILARLPFGARGPTVNAAAPQTINNHVFLTASYGVGARWIQLERESARPLWDRQDILSSQYSTCVEHHGTLYGIDGREDVGSATLRAVDPKTPSILWEEKNFGMANLLRVNDTIVLLKTDGELVLVQANSDRYVERARTQLDSHPVRALPAYSQGRLYVRGPESLSCYLLSER